MSLKDPMQYELFYETVGCVGSFVVCNLLLRWAFIVFLSQTEMGHEKTKARKTAIEFHKSRDMNPYVSLAKYSSSN